MKLEVLDVLNKKLVFLNENFNNANELFDFVGAKTKELDLAKNSYVDALKKRESDFPTAIQFNDVGVAIPHADSEHIKNEFIALVTLDEPIKFKAMEDSDQEIEVTIVFVLGLLKANDQLETLQAIVKLLQEKNALNLLNDADNINDVIDALNDL
ncbi:MAG: PTS sugar transporter subunit IIA [Tetragenococcus koreensis]|nr:PTS sugar transporter subunit IIA [Tetragenococcus koreensis]